MALGGVGEAVGIDVPGGMVEEGVVVGEWVAVGVAVGVGEGVGEGSMGHVAAGASIVAVSVSVGGDALALASLTSRTDAQPVRLNKQTNHKNQNPRKDRCKDRFLISQTATTYCSCLTTAKPTFTEHYCQQARRQPLNLGLPARGLS